MNMHVNTSAHSGVWATSSASAGETYAIFCVGNDKVREAAFRAWASAEGIGFKSLFGSYKGKQEASFIVNEKDLPQCAGWYRDEESILILGPLHLTGKSRGSRDAYLWYPSTDEQIYLGLFHETLRKYALTRDAWTFDPTTGSYYVTHMPQTTN